MEDALSTAKALADSNRLRIVAVLMEHDELCGCQVCALLGLAAATVSRHMAILHDAGLLRCRKAGRWVHYRLSDSLSPSLREWLKDSLSGCEAAALDRDTVRRILACDPRTLCACSRSGARGEQPGESRPPATNRIREESS
jgi:ArsR family transcriptional regulator